jgi:hypothetical protein
MVFNVLTRIESILLDDEVHLTSMSFDTRVASEVVPILIICAELFGKWNGDGEVERGRS